MTRRDRTISMALTAVVGLVLAAMSIEALGFMRYSMHFPLTFGTIGATVAAVLVLRDVRKLWIGADAEPEADTPEHDPNDPLTLGTHTPTPTYTGFIWIAAYLAAAPLIGFVAGTGLFTLVFLRLRAKASWWLAVPYTIGCLALVLALSRGLNLDWPPNLALSLYTVLTG